MSAATRQTFVYFCHKSGHDTMLIRDFFYCRFKKYRTVRGLQDSRITYCCFIGSRTGFSMQPFQWDAKTTEAD